MNRSEYIAALTGALRGKLAAGEIEDIVRDYNEFFEDGVMQGKTEEQVAVELGDPLEVAQQILSEEKFEPGRGKAPEGESSFKQRFTQGAEKVADGAEDFAKKANSFIRRKLEEYEERRSRRAEEKAARRSSGPRPRAGGGAVFGGLPDGLLHRRGGHRRSGLRLCGAGHPAAGGAVHRRAVRHLRAAVRHLLLRHRHDGGGLAGQGRGGVRPGPAVRPAHR